MDILTILTDDQLTIGVVDILTIDGELVNHGLIVGDEQGGLVYDTLSGDGEIAAPADFLSAFEAHAVSTQTIRLSWTATRTGDTYTVTRRLLPDGDWTTLDTSAAGPTYDDHPPLANVKYEYRVINNVYPTAQSTDPAWLTTIGTDSPTFPHGADYTTLCQSVPVWHCLPQAF